jgi:tRNA (guanine37-N1)-methyltransferase
LSLISTDLKVSRDRERVLIPISSELPLDLAAQIRESIGDYRVVSHDFEGKIKPPKTLDEALRDKLPAQLRRLIPRSIDLVGSIAVVEIPPELHPYRRVVGDAIMQVHRSVETVLAKSSPVDGVFRVREFEVLTGSGRTETLHRENGCLYHLDLSKVYFSPRLSHERARVASEVREGETVVDMFAGVGPFSILIARRRREVRVHAIDSNPDAVDYLKKNIEANRVGSKVSPYLGDARQVVRDNLEGSADRVVMNLPERAIEYVDAACNALKPTGGVIHYYEFSPEPDLFSKAQERLIEEVSRHGRRVEGFSRSRRVKSTAPHEWQIVLDTRIR